MSDRDTDPMDQAYAQAEGLLDDDAARAARRARVLAAIAADTTAEQQAPPAPRRSAWGRGGWLVAAGVAGVSVFVATQINRPPTFERPTAPPAEEAAPAPAPAPTTDTAEAPAVVAAPPAVQPPAQAPEPTARARSAAPPEAAPVIPPLPLPPVSAPSPPPPPPPATAAAAAPANAPSMERRMAAPAAPAAKARPPGRTTADESSRIEEIVVTGAKIERAPEDAPVAGVSRQTLDALSERLRSAAAAGRTREISALLSRGAPIDAADDDGETALMKAMEAKQLDAAALLRRRGASLDLENHEGRSARDMAAALADPALNKALGLDR